MAFNLASIPFSLHQGASPSKIRARRSIILQAIWPTPMGDSQMGGGL